MHDDQVVVTTGHLKRRPQIAFGTTLI